MLEHIEHQISLNDRQNLFNDPLINQVYRQYGGVFNLFLNKSDNLDSFHVFL